MERDSVSKILSANIVRLMKEKDVSATILAERSNLGRTAIYDIVTGRSNSPRVKTVAQIAEVLRVPLSDLFLTEEQLEAQAEMFRAYRMLPEQEQNRLEQIAKAWLPSP